MPGVIIGGYSVEMVLEIEVMTVQMNPVNSWKHVSTTVVFFIESKLGAGYLQAN